LSRFSGSGFGGASPSKGWNSKKTIVTAGSPAWASVTLPAGTIITSPGPRVFSWPGPVISGVAAMLEPARAITTSGPSTTRIGTIRDSTMASSKALRRDLGAGLEGEADRRQRCLRR